MLRTLAIGNFRSLQRLLVPLSQLTVITGPNGTGKSNLYRSLRLLAETAHGGVVAALARDGGLASSLWAGPETVSRRMRAGETPILGGPRRQTVRLRLGFGGDDFGYSIALGLPQPSRSAFALDPEIKHECIWSGPCFRASGALIERIGHVVKVREQRAWRVAAQHLDMAESMFRGIGDPSEAPELFRLREMIRAWRFYDQFRTDRDAALRAPQIGTRTPVLHHDGTDLAAALQTIREIGDRTELDAVIDDAFPGSELLIDVQRDGRFALALQQRGLLRPLTAAELSDGTLRYLALAAALLSPRPPPLIVLNEPETSLHSDLCPPLARLIARAAESTQIWVVSHSKALIAELSRSPHCGTIILEKALGMTQIRGQQRLEEPRWHWPDD